MHTVGTGKQFKDDGNRVASLDENPPNKVALALNIFAGLCGLWFCVCGFVWAYLIALWAAYPVGLLGWGLQRYAAKLGGETRLNRAVRIIHQLGLTLSLTMFVVFIIFEF